MGLTVRAHFKPFPVAAASPGIFHAQSKIDVLDVVLHRQRGIAFPVKSARNQRDGAARNQFANEDDTTSPHIRGFFPHIEAQIYFFEIAVHWNRKSKQARVEKEKADNTDKCIAIFVIEFRSWRHQRRDNRRIDNEIEYGEIPPIGGEEWLHAEEANYVTVIDHRGS